MPSSELYSAGLGGERIPAGSCAFPFFPPRIPVLMESPAQAPLREAERAASAPAGDAKGQSGKESCRIAPFPAPVQPAAALSLPASLRGPSGDTPRHVLPPEEPARQHHEQVGPRCPRSSGTGGTSGGGAGGREGERRPARTIAWPPRARCGRCAVSAMLCPLGKCGPA